LAEHDRRLSHDGSLACTSCHAPALAFSDGQPRSIAREVLDRNAPSLLNAGQQRWYGWDGASDSLWSQALRVMLEPREFGSSAAQLQALVRGDRDLSCRWRQVFGGIDTKQPERTMVQMAQAIGAYVGTLQSPRTPFDDFRDALVRGDHAAAASYPVDAQRGLQLFIGRARCALCHLGPMFSNGEFADVAVPFFVRPGVVDPGRHGGIAALQASRYNLLGPWARLQRGAAEATKTRQVQPQHRNFGEFKVPSLRHVALTAPYMHDGSIATLAEVIRHYDRIDVDRLHIDGERILGPLYLSEGEREDLLAFLRSLGEQPIAVPNPPSTSCR
jgi:cytochrome c peroxidase